MVFLPLPDSRRIVGIPEIILVGRLLQPSLLALSLTGLAALGFGTEALPLAVAIIRGKQFLAVQTDASTLLSFFHGFPNQRNHCPDEQRKEEENPAGRKIRTAKKEENFAVNPPNKIQAKKIQFQTAGFAPFSNRPWQRH
jgi:hypothetical protein